MATVTVIIPLYNKERQIERAIRSVLNQTFGDWTLIVVNDGSTDKGPQIARGITDSRMEVVDQANAGPGAARNTGLRLARTPYVSFLDADDEWHPEFLEATIKAILENDVALVATTMIELPKGRDTLQILKENGLDPGTFFFHGHEKPEKARALICILHPINILMKTCITEKSGNFITQNKCKFGEDTTFLWRIAFSEQFMIIGRALAYYHTEDSALGLHTTRRPLPPYLRDPRVLLDYCPPEKHALIKAVLDVLTLRLILNQAHHGQRLLLFMLLMQHPGAKRYKEEYKECLTRLMPGFFLWRKLKCGLSYYFSKWIIGNKQGK